MWTAWKGHFSAFCSFIDGFRQGGVLCPFCCFVWRRRRQSSEYQCWFIHICHMLQHFYSPRMPPKQIMKPLYGAKTAFTRSPITPSKVKEFGWNLDHSEYIVGSWLWTDFGRDPRSSYSWRGITIYRFPVGQTLRHWNTTTSIGMVFRNKNLKILLQGIVFPKVVFQKKPQKFLAKFPGDSPLFKNRPLRQISLNSVSESAKSSIIANRKPTMRFPSSHTWTLCVTPKSPKGWLNTKILTFSVAFHIFVAGNRRHFKFGMRIEYSKSQPTDDEAFLK